MKGLRCALICCVALGLCPCIVAAFDENQSPPSEKQLEHALASIRANSTEAHPDLEGQFGGLLSYEKGDYAGAMKYFLLGARYADKASQISIGLMYLNGQGVTKDPVTAYAWIALSAERNYPKFVATRDSVGAQLNAEQRAKADDILKQLMAEYGDAVAKPRMVHELQQAKLHMTGSPAGFEGDLQTGTLAQFSNDLGSSGSTPRNPDIAGMGATGLDLGGVLPRCDLAPVEGGTINGCGDFWADNRWKSSEYFKTADSFWSSTVKVGPLESVSNNSTHKAPPKPPLTDQPQEGAHL